MARNSSGACVDTRLLLMPLPAPQPPAAHTAVRTLFIGNSYLLAHDLPGVYRDLMTAALPHTIQVRAATCTEKKEGERW